MLNNAQDFFRSKNLAGFKIHNHQQAHFITFAVVGLYIHDWCLLTNHIHLVISAKEGCNLSDILRDFKSIQHQPFLKIWRSKKRKAEENGCCDCSEKQERGIPKDISQRFLVYLLLF